MKGLAKDPDRRWQSASEMALALETALAPATALRISAWVRDLAQETLARRAEEVASIESAKSSSSLTAKPAVSGDEHTRTAVTSDTPNRSLGARRTRWRIAAIAATSLLAAVGIGFLFGRAPRVQSEPPTASSPNDEPGDSPPGTELVSPSRALSSPVASTVSPSASDSLPLSSAAPDADSKRSATVPRRERARPSGTSSGAKSTKPGCDPPYTIDGRGIVHMKRECL
jgi:serine/threonine-protein kinase